MVDSLAPNNIVFVAVGAVVGAILVTALTIRIASWCISRSKAKTDKEVYFHNSYHKFSTGSSVDSASFLLGTSSRSSLLEKSSSSSNMLEKLSINMDVSGQGRTYRDMLANMDRRGSMTIGPVLELMMTSSRNVDLPMLHDTVLNAEENTSLHPQELPILHSRELPMLHSQDMGLRILLGAPSMLDKPVYADLVPESRNDSRNESRNESRRERPPSQLLDDLLDGVDFTLDPGVRPL